MERELVFDIDLTGALWVSQLLHVDLTLDWWFGWTGELVVVFCFVFTGALGRGSRACSWQLAGRMHAQGGVGGGVCRATPCSPTCLWGREAVWRLPARVPARLPACFPVYAACLSPTISLPPTLCLIRLRRRAHVRQGGPHLRQVLAAHGSGHQGGWVGALVGALVGLRVGSVAGAPPRWLAGWLAGWCCAAFLLSRAYLQFLQGCLWQVPGARPPPPPPRRGRLGRAASWVVYR